VDGPRPAYSAQHAGWYASRNRTTVPAVPQFDPARQRALAGVIRDLRTARSLSQEELADRAGLNRKSVGAIERLEWAPSFAAVEGIADGLGIMLSELIRVYEERLGS